MAALAMALGSMLVSGLINLSGDIGGQVGRELRDYGANVVIRPPAQAVSLGSGGLEFGTLSAAQTLPESAVQVARALDEVVGAVPYLYSLVEAGRTSAILAGVDLAEARRVNTWWQVQGRWPEAADEVLVGAAAAGVLAVEPGERLALKYGGQVVALTVVGILETGGAEDEQLVVTLARVQALTGQPGRVGLIMVSALVADQPLAATTRELQGALPEAEVQALAQFARAEATVLTKVRLLMGLVAALVLAAGALTVAGTLNIIVMERRTEIGLMKALGAANRRVAGLFLAESLCVGALGALAGYLAGLGLSAFIGWRVFDAAIPPSAWALPGTLLVGLAVTLVAGVAPVRRALSVDPIKTLRGE